MTNKIFFTSDSHFGHKRIIELCNRPFASVEEMDAEMIRQWNETVEEDDIVYHLGDFMFYKNDTGIFDKLNGTKILIQGNHDHSATRSLGWYAINQYLEVTVDYQRLVLFHYPIEDWAGHFHGSIHLFGHTHNLPTADIENRYCACVEKIGYAPVPLEYFLKKEKI